MVHPIISPRFGPSEWDKRSVMLELLDGGNWHLFRLPIADHSYTAAHGWYTEWPRIRQVTPDKLLMNIHGQWLDFPRTFSITNSAGIRPVADYLKITGDFASFNNQIVFGCDDASMMQNPLDGQSESNLWFTTWDDLKKAGRPDGTGGPWLNDAVKSGESSVPYLYCRIRLPNAASMPVFRFSGKLQCGSGHRRPRQVDFSHDHHGSSARICTVYICQTDHGRMDTIDS